MPNEPAQHVTRLLHAWRSGERDALDEMMPLVEAELRRLAGGYLRNERRGHTLQTTALVNEAYLRLIDQKGVSWQNRAHFFGIAAQMMRRILVDYARRRRATKRGGEQECVELDEATALVPERGADVVDVIAVHEVLERLTELDPRQAQIVELRIFAGLQMKEIGEVLGLSRATINREWDSAKAWLHRELSRR